MLNTRLNIMWINMNRVAVVLPTSFYNPQRQRERN